MLTTTLRRAPFRPSLRLLPRSTTSLSQLPRTIATMSKAKSEEEWRAQLSPEQVCLQHLFSSLDARVSCTITLLVPNLAEEGHRTCWNRDLR